MPGLQRIAQKHSRTSTHTRMAAAAAAPTRTVGPTGSHDPLRAAGACGSRGAAWRPTRMPPERRYALAPAASPAVAGTLVSGMPDAPPLAGASSARCIGLQGPLCGVESPLVVFSWRPPASRRACASASKGGTGKGQTQNQHQRPPAKSRLCNHGCSSGCAVLRAPTMSTCRASWQRTMGRVWCCKLVRSNHMPLS